MLTALILLNIPVYLFIGWLVFDTKEDAAETFLETILAIFKAGFVPLFASLFIRDDNEAGFGGLIPIAIWLIACGLIVYGECRLIEKYWLESAP
jgi:hypothetical protein